MLIPTYINTYIPIYSFSQEVASAGSDNYWFLSATAQSVAAIVGILAGFITMTLINNHAEYKRKSSRLEAMKLDTALDIVRFHPHEQILDAIVLREKTKSFRLSFNGNPESSTTIYFMLGGIWVLYIVGIIVPLYYLPHGPTLGEASPQKIIVLSVVSVVFVFSCGLWLIASWRLRYTRDEKIQHKLETIDNQIKELDEYIENAEGIKAAKNSERQ